MLFMGDFNYNSTAYITDTGYSNEPILNTNTNNSGAAIHRRFHQLVNHHFFECTHAREEGPVLPTCRLGSSKSTIDYLYASPFLYQHLHDSDIVFLESFWTDHALLRAQFIFSSDRQGPRLCSASPRLASNPFFTNLLFPAIDEFFTTVELTESLDCAASIDPATPQTNWDALKSLVQGIAKRVSRDKSSVLERQSKRLQRKRNRICRQYPDNRRRNIQKDMTENQRIRAGHNWRVNGEASAGFLKRTIETRSAAATFYGDLYFPNPVVPDSVTTLCNTIPSSDTIPDTAHQALLHPFSIADIQLGSHRTKLLSSPSIDGLPYAILNVLLQHSKVAKLAVTVFNETLTSCILPPTWLKNMHVLTAEIL
ncbi:hypothetical protein PS6_011742 [Mucor atramentarius]